MGLQSGPMNAPLMAQRAVILKGAELFAASAAMEKPPAPAPKKRKIEVKTQRNLPSQATTDTGKTPMHATQIPMIPVGIKDPKIQQAKKYVVAQAQQEGWLGNFRSFDSPFGNYIVPVIPTHADLFGTDQLKNC